MKSQSEEIRAGGKTIKVPFCLVNGRKVITTGGWIKTAAVKDEELCEGEAVDNPDFFIAQLKQGQLKADIFTFSQRPADNNPKYGYCMEWDNAAMIPVKDFSDWWENRLPQETRRNVKRAAKLGVTVKITRFDDELVRGIVDIYNETPIRQGRRFWHYGKSFEAVKEETGTYLDRSEFIGAYYNNELVGILKMVYVDQYASIIHILSKIQHSDKRPTNALIAKAVEICAAKGLSYFLYCKYVYGRNDNNPLTEFKRRNGFEQACYPRYYVPLTAKGKLVLGLKLHHGFGTVLPKSLLTTFLGLRKKCFEILDAKRGRLRKQTEADERVMAGAKRKQ